MHPTAPVDERTVFDCAIVGAGFTGLAAALELTRSGHHVCLLEAEDSPGGLAGSFFFDDGIEVDKFYHHWFTSDNFILNMLRELELHDRVIWKITATGTYLNTRIWRLSSPADLLRFEGLSFGGRIRLGIIALYVRLIRDYRTVEDKSIREWLEPLVGKEVYRVVWEPLVTSKFGSYAESVSAAWMWKKLTLRGGSRQRGGREQLGYLLGGFGQISRHAVRLLRDRGSDVRLGTSVQSIIVRDGVADGVLTNLGTVRAESVLLTTPEPVTRNFLVAQEADTANELERPRVAHLANICVVLRLAKSLSETYWLNVNDPGFPFVGVVEHTNLDASAGYGGSHIVYLSRYLDPADPIWETSEREYLDYCLPFIRTMFPEFDESWILDSKVWRAEFAQPVTTIGYSASVPPVETSISNVFVANMAQIYPEDRGTNFAVREGERAAKRLHAFLSSERP